MGCIEYGCMIYEKSKKENRGCLEVLGDDCKNCCRCDPPRSEEELKALEIGDCLQFGQEKYYEKLYLFKKLNLELLKKIYQENERLKVIMKKKISSLFSDGSLKNPKVIIGTGNSCNNDCYLYNLNLQKKCPKCDGKVEEDFENDYTIEHEWDEKRGVYEETKKYNEKKICTDFRWNNNIDKCDVTLKGMFDFFDKKDPEKITHYSIVVEDETTKEKKTEEYDVENHYMMLDGERFDFPLGLTMWQFFYHNNKFFFPEETSTRVKGENGVFVYDWNGEYCYRTTFWYEGLKVELGQSLGYYGYAWRHMVYIYTCNSCGYKYHIIKTSPFAFRDKSKDPK